MYIEVGGYEMMTIIKLSEGFPLSPGDEGLSPCSS